MLLATPPRRCSSLTAIRRSWAWSKVKSAYLFPSLHKTFAGLPLPVSRSHTASSLRELNATCVPDTAYGAPPYS